MPVLVKAKKCPHCDGDAPRSECICGSMTKAKTCPKCGCDDCVSKNNCGGDVKKALFSNAWAFLKQDDDPLGEALAANSGPRETPPTLQLPGMVNTADEPTLRDQITDMLRDKRDIQNFVDELRNRKTQGELEEMVAHDMNEVKQGRLPHSTLYTLPEDVLERVDLKQRGVIPEFEPPEPDNSVSEGPDWRDDRY